MALRPLTPRNYKKLMNSDSKESVNQNHIILSFIDFDFSPEVISQELNLTPLSTGIKGEEYYLSKGKVKKVRDVNHWEFEWKIYSNDFIGNFISKFIQEVIKGRLAGIKKINASCLTRLTIVQYYYTGWNPGISFSAEEMKILAEINAEIDIDIYALASENQ